MEEEPVPKLPRGRGIKLSGPEIVRICITAALLVAIIVLAEPCGNAVSNFMMRFDNGSASKKMPKPETVTSPQQGVLLRGDMTDEERKAAIERARAAAGSAGSN
jgi:hypothetical protein